MKLPFYNSDKSATPIVIVIFTLMVTILQIFNYFYFWLANIITYILVFYFSPPKELVKSHLDDTTPNHLIILGGAFYVFFMFIDNPWLGSILSVILAMQYIYKIHSTLLLVIDAFYRCSLETQPVLNKPLLAAVRQVVWQLFLLTTLCGWDF